MRKIKIIKILAACLLAQVIVLAFGANFAHAAYNGNPSLKYFGYFNVACSSTLNEIPEVAKVGNVNTIHLVIGDDNSFRSCLQSAKENNLKVVISPTWYFWQWNTNTPWPNYDMYNRFRSLISGYEGIIYAYYFDEPAWRNFSEADFRNATKRLRTDYPSIGVLTFEGAPVLDKNTPSRAYYEYVTDFGFDYYGNDFGNFTDWNIDGYRAYFNKFMTKLHSPGQKIWIIPQTFTNNTNTSIPRLESILNDYYSLAQNDGRIVGIMNFLFSDTWSGSSDPSYGMQDFFAPSSVVYGKSGAASYRSLNAQLARVISNPKSTKEFLASRKVAAVASSAYGGSTPNLAVDGDAATIWNSGGVAPRWIELNLGRPQTVTTIRMLPNQTPTGHVETTIQVKRKAADPYMTVKAFSADVSDSKWITYVPGIPLRDFQYIKITTTNSPGWVSWREIEAYASDSTPPAISTVQPTGGINTSAAKIGVNYSDAGAGIIIGATAVQLDGSTLSGCSPTATNVSCQVSGLAKGRHVASISLKDRMGNTASKSWAFVYETTAPQISNTKPDRAVSARSATISATINDPVGPEGYASGINASAVVKLDGQVKSCRVARISATQASLSCPVANPAPGYHKVSALIRDRAGNFGSKSWTFLATGV